jgi:hypothetical protein
MCWCISINICLRYDKYPALNHPPIFENVLAFGVESNALTKSACKVKIILTYNKNILCHLAIDVRILTHFLTSNTIEFGVQI